MMPPALKSGKIKLETLIRELKPLAVKGLIHREITSIAYDSRHVRPGSVFVACRGARHDGSTFIHDALKRGAVAIVSEREAWTREDVPHLQVENARKALAETACAFYDHPSRKLELIGITGTNGKTTTSYIAHALLRAAGKNPGLIGTIRYQIGERSIPAGRTTPEAPDLHAMLYQMLQVSSRSAVVEVSSHGLAQKRVWGVDFDVAAFTNLTRDHLDYHQNMDDYFDVKSLLFR